LFCAAVIAALIASPACGHGGGGGGGGGFVFFGPYPALYIEKAPDAVVGKYDNIHTVAILSSLGSAMTVVRENKFSSNDTREQDISSFDIDGLVKSTLQRYLRTRFTIKDMPYDEHSLRAIPSDISPDSNPDLRPYLASVPNEGIDAFVIVHPASEDDAHRPQAVSVSLTRFGVMLTFSYIVDIIDAHNYGYIAKATSRIQPYTETADRVSKIELPPALMPSPDLVLTSTQISMLQRYLQHYVQRTLVDTLQSLNLGLVLPPPGARKIVEVPKNELRYPNIKSVAVVSAIADQLAFEIQGSGFGPSASVVDVPIPADWNTDGEIESQIAKEVSGRFTVKDTGGNRAILFKASPMEFETFNKLRDSITELTPRADIDAYIVVMKEQAVLDSAGTMTTGGLVVRKIDSSTNGLLASYDVLLVDAHTLKVVAGQSGVTSPQFGKGEPYAIVKDVLWPSTPGQPEEPQLAIIRSHIDEMIPNSISETLLRMDLTGKEISLDLPDTGDLPH
jgi:hypothetical protein